MCLQDAPDVAVFCIGRLKSFQAAFCKAGRSFTISGIPNFRKQRFQAALLRWFFAHWGSLKIISNHPFQSSHGVIMSWINFVRRCRFWARRKWRQMRRLSRKSVPLLYLLIGSLLVAGVSMVFAQMAEFALEQNRHWVKTYPWFAWVALPLGLMLIAWLMRRFAPYTVGSGIPQVIASIALPYGRAKKRAVGFRETLLKVPLTFLGMLCGASIGREGPSVQVGAAVMASWGRWCKKRNLAFTGLQDNDLLAAGAAGGLAAAFNAPLAGVIFAIEELGRDVMLRWERQIFIGILAAGFAQVAIMGNHPYFSNFYAYGTGVKHLWLWVLAVALVCGVMGGLFSRLLFKGVGWVIPSAGWKAWVQRRPILLAGLMGLLLAAVGTVSGGDAYGTGAAQVLEALHNQYHAQFGMSLWKWLATIFSYWAGIPGGIFTPCLTIGAMIGHDLAQLAGLGLGGNVLVLLGMVAFLSGATQSPLTASVVVMEMTGSQQLLVWMLMGGLVATAVSRQFSPKPFYHAAAARFRQRVAEECKAGR